MIKKLLALALGTIILVGCSVEGESTAVQAPETTQYVEPVKEPGADLYIDSIVAQYPNMVNTLGKPWLVEFGNTICSEIDRGMTLNELALMTVRYDIDAEMIGFITGLAIRNFCPDNQWFIDAALQA